MAVTINASTSSGVITTADNSGVLQLQTNNGQTAMTINTSQNVGIGTASPTSNLTINRNASFTGTPSNPNVGLHLIAADSGNIGTSYDGFGANTQITFRRSNGTLSSPSALLSGNVIGAITWRGYGATGYSSGNRGLINLVAAENWTDTAQGTSFVFNTVASGTTSSTEKMRIDSDGNVGIGTTSPGAKLDVNGQRIKIQNATDPGIEFFNASTVQGYVFYDTTNNLMTMRHNSTGTGVSVNSSGIVLVGKSVTTFSTAGTYISPSGEIVSTRNADSVISVNRTTNDGTLVAFFQDGTLEGTISVSGSTVSYNGGHLSRWSQWQNETGQPNAYRGTVLESVDAMCEWEKDGEPLPNEQATKTIVSTTLASKAVAGVFDRYDEDDEDNPYDFYVAQSGDFVIRIAQGVTVQNGDLLESAGDGTAKPQADDICRSSTIAKVTSNYVSATYEDGSYCVPCILMIG